MKKLIGILAVAALTTSVFAQGTVGVNNLTGLVKQWTSTSDSTIQTMPRSGGYVQLFAASAGTTLVHPLFTGNAAAGEKLFANYDSLSGFLAANPGWALAVNTAGSPAAWVSSSSGIFNGGTYSINGINAGANAQYFMIGWSGTGTFDAALTGALLAGSATRMGQSGVFQTATGNPLATPPGAAISLSKTFTGMTLAPVYVPEPSTFALAGLGVAALLVFRRRK